MRFRNEKTGKIIIISDRATTQRDVLKTLMEQGELPTNDICTITEHTNCYNASHSLEGKNILRSEKYRAGVGLKDPITGNFLTRATYKSISTARKGAIAEITIKVDKISTIYDTKGLSKRSTEVKLMKLVGHDELPATPRDWTSGSKIKEVLSPNLIDYSTKNWWRDKKLTDSLGLMEHYVTDQKIIPTSQRTPWLKNTVKQVTGFVPIPYSMCSWEYNSELNFEGFIDIDPSIYYKPFETISDTELNALLKASEDDLFMQIGLNDRYRIDPRRPVVDYSSEIMPKQVFSLGEEYKEYLVEGPINPNLVQAFRDNTYVIQNDATVSLQAPRTVVINDRGLQYKIRYTGSGRRPYNVEDIKDNIWERLQRYGKEKWEEAKRMIHDLLCSPRNANRSNLLNALRDGTNTFITTLVPLIIASGFLQAIALLLATMVLKMVIKYGLNRTCIRLRRMLNLN